MVYCHSLSLRKQVNECNRISSVCETVLARSDG